MTLKTRKKELNLEDRDSSINKAHASFFLKLVVSLLLIFLVFVAFKIQVKDSAYYESNVEKSISTFAEQIPQRGKFYDSKGRVLVKNQDRYNLLIKYPFDFEGLPEKLDLLLSKGLSFDKDSVLKGLKGINYDYSLQRNIDANEFIELSELVHQSEWDDLYFTQDYKRNYLYPYQFSNVIGYTSLATLEDVKNGYTPNDQKGIYKLEYSYEDQLKGVKGKKVNLDGVDILQEAQPGNDVYLTINLDWQNKLYDILGRWADELGSAGAAGVVMDVNNGNIIALVSYPGFDSNMFIDGISESDYQNLLNARNTPLIDKTVSLHAPPGSIFKLITSYELLEKQVVDSNSIYYSAGCISIGNSDFCEYGKNVYGYMNIERALYKSSNLFFCENLLEYSRSHSLEDFANTAKSFGIGEKTGVNVPGEIAGNMDSPTYKKENFDLDWYDGDTCNVAIGQGSVLVTPIQMATVVALYANGGELLQPNVIESVQNKEGKVVSKSEKIVRRKISFNESTTDLVLSGMYQVANSPEGTVYYFLHDLPGNLRVKTGSSETVEVLNNEQIDRVNGWAIGLFDYDGKTYSFSILMPYAGGSFYMTQALRDFILSIYNQDS